MHTGKLNRSLAEHKYMSDPYVEQKPQMKSRLSTGPPAHLFDANVHREAEGVPPPAADRDLQPMKQVCFFWCSSFHFPVVSVINCSSSHSPLVMLQRINQRNTTRLHHTPNTCLTATQSRVTYMLVVVRRLNRSDMAKSRRQHHRRLQLVMSTGTRRVKKNSFSIVSLLSLSLVFFFFFALADPPRQRFSTQQRGGDFSKASSLHTGDPFVDKSKQSQRNAGPTDGPAWKASTVALRCFFISSFLKAFTHVHSLVIAAILVCPGCLLAHAKKTWKRCRARRSLPCMLAK